MYSLTIKDLYYILSGCVGFIHVLVPSCLIIQLGVTEDSAGAAVGEAVFIKSETVCKDGTKESIGNMAVSAAGVIAYCKHREDSQGILWRSLHVLRQGTIKTLIPETESIIHGMTFLQVGGKEQLMVCREPQIILLDPDGEVGMERELFQVEHFTPLCTTEENKALHVQLSQNQGEWEVTALKVTSLIYYEKYTKLLKLGWDSLSDMCIVGDRLVICSYKDESVMGVCMDEWEIKWIVPLKCAWNVCPSMDGSVLVACPNLHSIQKLSTVDGAVITQLHLVPNVVFPTCLFTIDDTLYVAHEDVEVWVSKKQRDWKISQYKLEQNTGQRLEFVTPSSSSC